MLLAPETTAAVVADVTNTPATFDLELAPGQFYLFCSSTACWVSQGDSPTASASNGSMLLPPNTIVPLDGKLGAHVSVVRDIADGRASVVRAQRF